MRTLLLDVDLIAVDRGWWLAKQDDLGITGGDAYAAAGWKDRESTGAVRVRTDLVAAPLALAHVAR